MNDQLESEDYLMYLIQHLKQIPVRGNYYDYGALANPSFSSEMKISLYLKTLAWFKNQGLLILNGKGTKYVVSLDNFTIVPKRDREIFSELIDNKDFKFSLGKPKAESMDELVKVLWRWAKNHDLLVKEFVDVKSVSPGKVASARAFWLTGGVTAVIGASVTVVDLYNGFGLAEIIGLSGIAVGGGLIAGGFPVWKKRNVVDRSYNDHASLSEKGKKWVIEQKANAISDETSV